MTTLGEIYAQELQEAVDRGFIYADTRKDWIANPPRSFEDARRRKFILHLVREGFVLPPDKDNR